MELPRFHSHEQVFRGPAQTPCITAVTRSLTRLITSAKVFCAKAFDLFEKEWGCECTGVIVFGQFRIQPISSSANSISANTTKCGAFEGWSPEGLGAQNFALFFSFLRHNSLSWGPCVELWWCLKRRAREKCTFGVLGLSCASLSGPVWWGGSLKKFLANVFCSSACNGRPAKCFKLFHRAPM